MQKLTQYEIDAILEYAPRPLDLSALDLRDASLWGASLWGCAGERKRIKSIFISDTYPITYTIDRIQIGCKNHSIEDWKSFDDYEISEMDYAALEWWNDHKDFIFKTIERFPAEK